MRRFVISATLCCVVLGLVVGRLSDGTTAFASYDLHLDATSEVNLLTPVTLCERNEQVVFSCVMQKSAKLLSICTSRQFDRQNGYVQYRLGQLGRIQLEFPSERSDTQSAFSYDRYTRPLVTFLSLRFESNGFKYSIHQDSNAEEKPPVNSSYVNVTAPDENAKPIEMICRQPVVGSLMLLEDAVPGGVGDDVLNP